MWEQRSWSLIRAGSKLEFDTNSITIELRERFLKINVGGKTESRRVRKIIGETLIGLLVCVRGNAEDLKTIVSNPQNSEDKIKGEDLVLFEINANRIPDVYVLI